VAYPDVPAKWSKLLSLKHNGVEEAQTEDHPPPINSESWRAHESTQHRCRFTMLFNQSLNFYHSELSEAANIDAELIQIYNH